MPTFSYSAYGPRGELALGNLEAATADAASELLWARGLAPFRITSDTGAGKRWWQRELSFSLGPRRVDLAAFTREFATLMGADIPLDDALGILSDRSEADGIASLVKDLRADVLNGLTLSEAMRKRPQTFPQDYLSLVRAGEIGGAVGQVFAELADLLERRQEIRARVRSAMVYPALLIALALASLAIIGGVLVPSIAGIFAGTGRPMPVSIQFMIALQSNWLAILIVLAFVAGVAAWAGARALRKPENRIAFDRLMLKIPLAGTFVLQHETARFARTLGTLLKAGVPLLQAAASARDVVANRHLGAGIERAIDQVREGAALHRSLRAETLLPALAIRMIAIGEEASKVDWMLLRVAATFEQQSQRAVDRFMTVLTPALTLLMAGMVGGIIMAVIDAVMSMNDLAFQ